MDAAIELFAAGGIRGTSLAAIGERAGMSRGAVNFHFGSKENLIAEAVGRVVSDWQKDIEIDEPRDEAAVVATFDSLFALHRWSLEEQTESMSLFYSVVFEALGTSSHMRDQIAELIRHQRSQVASFVARAQDAGVIAADVRPDAFAAWFTAAIRGLGYHYMVEGKSRTLDETYAELRAAVLGRLLQHGSRNE